jgi:hypothetical protein
MQPIELPNGNLLIPARAEGPDGMIGDGVREIGPDDPEFQGLVGLVAEPPYGRGGAAHTPSHGLAVEDHREG